MSVALVVAILIAFVGLLFAWSGLRRFANKKILSAFSLELTGISLILLAAILLLISSNLIVYQRLIYEAPVATLHFKQKQALLFVAEITTADAQTRTYEMLGDEWQLDARMLKWHGLANLLGLDAQYRLHRLSGRYTNIDQERVASRSIHQIDEPPKIDIWTVASNYNGWVNWFVDAAYGSAVYLPMTDDALYEITVSQTGLVARPVNAPAKQAVSRWVGL